MPSQRIVSTQVARNATRDGMRSDRHPQVSSTLPASLDQAMTPQRRSIRLTAAQARARNEQRAVWLSERPLITPQTVRPLPKPNFCPLCPPARRHVSATTVTQLLSHLRTTHCSRSVAGKPRASQLRVLKSFLDDVGCWYCHTHDKYLGTNVGSRTPHGLFPFTYTPCPRCSIQSSPPTYHPLHSSQLAPAPNPAEINAVPESDPPPPPITAPTRAQPSQHQPLPSAEDIFTTHIPLVSHIPTRHRQALAEIFRLTIQKAVSAGEANSPTASEEYLKIFLFPSVLLTNPSSSTRNESLESDDAPTGAQVYKRRMQLWAEGKYQTLWSEAKKCATYHATRALPQQEQKEANVRRALRLAKEGAYSKAAQALQSDGIIPPSAETSRALREKHPQSTPPTDAAQYVRPEVRPQFTPFTSDQVLTAVRKFRPGSAAGGSGLRPNHLDELLRAPYVNHNHSLRKEVTRLVNALASGSAPQNLSPWIAGAPLTALAKRGPGIRPIAVGETIRRLVSSCCMTRVSKKATRLLRPLQVGIATKGGAEATIHSVRRLYDLHCENSKYALLSVDLKNAFNLCSRNAFLENTKQSLPEILAWVEYCYASEHAFLWTGHDTLRSVLGVQQGDPLGPLLFALALNAMLNMIRQLRPTNVPDETELAELLLQLWYLDDGYIIASHSVLQSVLSLLSSSEAISRGLYLSVPKCRVWWPSPPPQHIKNGYPPDLKQDYSDGTLVLNAPIGSHRFMETYTLTHVRSLQPLFDAISDLEDIQVAFQLLRNCLGVSKMSYLLRVVPPYSITRAATLYDEMVERALRTILGGVLDPVIFRELQLPVQAPIKDRPSLGLGLTSAVSVSAASFLASAAASNDICKDSLPHALTALTTYQAAVDSYNAWASKCIPESTLPLSAFCSAQTPPQRKLSALVHQQVQFSLPPSEDRVKQFRACMALPGAKDWVYCVPAKGLKTYICSREFRTWLQYFCQVLLFPSNSPCPREGCPELTDVNGDHLLHCRYGGFRIHRHDDQVRLLATDLSKAVRHPVVEPREGGLHRVRPDIAATGTQGGTDYLDITFITPMAPSYTRARNFNPLSCLNTAHRDKHRRFQEFIQTAGEAARLLPVPIAATGGWHPSSYSLLKTIAGAIATRAVEPFWRARNLLFQRHAALAVTSNALCLLGGSVAPL